MKLNSILEIFDPPVTHTVYPKGEYGYIIIFGYEEHLSLKTVVSGEFPIQNWLFKKDETLSVTYNIENNENERIVEFEVKINNRKKNFQDGQFNIDDDGLTLLKKDINLKLEEFRNIVDNKNGIQIIENTYKKLWETLNELH